MGLTLVTSDVEINEIKESDGILFEGKMKVGYITTPKAHNFYNKIIVKLPKLTK